MRLVFINKFLFSILCGTLLLTVACRKDSPSGDNSPSLCLSGLEQHSVQATNIDSTFTFGCSWGVETQKPSYNYYTPVFNPNNINEIAYLRYGGPAGCNYELWIYDLCSGQGTVIANNVCYAMQWGINGWLIYTASDGYIYKVKSSGADLTQLVPGNYATWNQKGDKFAYKKWNVGEGLIISDQDGNTLASILELDDTQRWKIIDEYRLLVNFYGSSSHSHYGPEIYNMGTGAFEAIDGLVFTGDSLVNSLCYNKSGNAIVWNTLKLIASTNITSKFRTTLRKGASNRMYEDMDLSADGKYVIFSRTNIRKITECKKYEEHRIYIMSTDGTYERELQLPGM